MNTHNDWAMNKDREYRQVLAEAAEFGERFPDKQDDEILDHINFVFSKRVVEDSVLAKGIILAFEGDYDAGLRYISSAWMR